MKKTDFLESRRNLLLIRKIKVVSGNINDYRFKDLKINYSLHYVIKCLLYWRKNNISSKKQNRI
jgi:hypothetical protein